jgi:hypothetical protein
MKRYVLIVFALLSAVIAVDFALGTRGPFFGVVDQYEEVRSHFATIYNTELPRPCDDAPVVMPDRFNVSYKLLDPRGYLKLWRQAKFSKVASCHTAGPSWLNPNPCSSNATISNSGSWDTFGAHEIRLLIMAHSKSGSIDNVVYRCAGRNCFCDRWPRNGDYSCGNGSTSPPKCKPIDYRLN